MADPFVDLGLTTDQGLLADTAVQGLQDQLPDYVPQPGNMEVIQIDVIAPMAAEQAAVAAIVPAAIFRNYGTKLVGIPYLNGTNATAAVSFTLTDTDGHTIPAGTDFTVGGLAFQLQADVIVANGDDTGAGVLVAAESGVAYNGLSSPVYLVNGIDWVSSIALTGSSSGGIDQEDDTAYLNRLVGQLALQAPRPITATDYQTFVLSFSPEDGTDQQEVGRATAIDGYDPTAHTFTANTTNSSATLASVSSFTHVTVGSALSGTGIPANTTVLSVNTGASTLVMSNPATATNTGVTVTATGTYNNARTITVFLAAADGTALNGSTRTAVQTWLQTYREVNFLVYAQSPTYTTVYATASIKVYPNFDASSVALAVQDAMVAYLSPAEHGSPSPAPPGVTAVPWLNDTAIRYNKLLGIIEQVAGVDYAPSLTLGLTASPVGVVDLTLPGPAPLPLADTTTVPVPTVV